MFLSGLECGGFERGHLLFCLNVYRCWKKGLMTMFHEVWMGAKEGPRAPNEPPTPPARTKDMFCFIASLFWVCWLMPCCVWHKVNRDRELPKHVGFSAWKHSGVCQSARVILFLKCLGVRDLERKRELFNLDSDVEESLKELWRARTFADGYFLHQPLVDYSSVCCTYTLMIIITMINLTGVVLCLTTLMICSMMSVMQLTL